MTNLNTFINYRNNCLICGYQLSTSIRTKDGSPAGPYKIEGNNIVFDTDFRGWSMSKHQFVYKTIICIDKETNEFKIDIRDNYSRKLDTVPIKRIDALIEYYRNRKDTIKIRRDCSSCKRYYYDSQELYFNFPTRKIWLDLNVTNNIGLVKYEMCRYERSTMSRKTKVYYLVRENQGNFIAHVGKMDSNEYIHKHEIIDKIDKMKYHIELPNFQIEGRDNAEIMRKLDMFLFFS